MFNPFNLLKIIYDHGIFWICIYNNIPWKGINFIISLNWFFKIIFTNVLYFMSSCVYELILALITCSLNFWSNGFKSFLVINKVLWLLVSSIVNSFCSIKNIPCFFKSLIASIVKISLSASFNISYYLNALSYGIF